MREFLGKTSRAGRWKVYNSWAAVDSTHLFLICLFYPPIVCVSECEGERGQLLVSCTCMLLFFFFFGIATCIICC